jgi:hypothetical protein
MNEIKIEKIKLKPMTHKWESGKGTIYEFDNPLKDFEVIPKKSYKEFLEEIKSEKLLVLNKFDETKKVFFHSSVTFSRSKFRELFPKTKVTYSIENADAVIIDKDNFMRTLTYYYPHIYLAPGHNPTGNPADDFFCDSLESPFIDPAYKAAGVPREEFLIVQEKAGKRNNLNKEVIGFMNLIISGAKDFIDVDTIALKSELVIDEQTFNRINQLLSSNNPGNMQLACNMLTGYDYEESHTRMALLLKLNWYNWDNYREKKSFIDLKTVLNRLNKDYPYLTHSSGYNPGPVDKKFWYSLFSNYSHDNIVHAYFHDWFNKEMSCVENNIEILLRIKGKEDTFVFDVSSKLTVEERIQILNQKDNVLENAIAEVELIEENEPEMSGGLPF